MIDYTNECVGCPPEMGCLGPSCPNRNVPNYFCDECGDSCAPSQLYDVDGRMLCAHCILSQYKTVAEGL